MRPDKSVLAALRRIAPEPLTGTFYRVVRVEFIDQPLGTLGSKRFGGRYNLKGKFDVLYLSSDHALALKEASPGSLKFTPHLILSVTVRLKKVISLVSPELRSQIGVSIDELLVPWRHDQDILGKEAITQRLGRLIRSTKRFEAIVYPSKVDPSRSNLAVFMDRLRKGSAIDLYDPEMMMQWVFRGKQ